VNKQKKVREPNIRGADDPVYGKYMYEWYEAGFSYVRAY
jgi:hypothetical protein